MIRGGKHDQEPEDYRDKLKKHRIMNLYRTFIFIVLILVILLIIYARFQSHIYTGYEVIASGDRNASESQKDLRLGRSILSFSHDGAHCIDGSGKTVWDRMIEMYEEYGYFKETQYSLTLKGVEGSKQIAAIMEKLRNNPPKMLGDLKVLKFRDYDRDVIKDMATGDTCSTGLPKSNVLYFDLEDDAWCCARPSGTEPKLKFYMGVKGSSLDDATAKNNALTDAVKALL